MKIGFWNAENLTQNNVDKKINMICNLVKDCHVTVLIEIRGKPEELGNKILGILQYQYGITAKFYFIFAGQQGARIEYYMVLYKSDILFSAVGMIKKPEFGAQFNKLVPGVNQHYAEGRKPFVFDIEQAEGSQKLRLACWHGEAPNAEPAAFWQGFIHPLKENGVSYCIGDFNVKPANEDLYPQDANGHPVKTTNANCYDYLKLINGGRKGKIYQYQFDLGESDHFPMYAELN